MRKKTQYFRKNERLKAKASFRNLFSDGKYYGNSNVSLRLLPNELTISRLGISVQKSIFPEAVQRNRVKRLIREAFRLHKTEISRGYDILIKPKSAECCRYSYRKMEACLFEVFKIAGVVK